MKSSILVLTLVDEPYDQLLRYLLLPNRDVIVMIKSVYLAPQLKTQLSERQTFRTFVRKPRQQAF